MAESRSLPDVPMSSTIRPRQKERKHYTEDAINDEEIEGKRMFSVEEKLTSEKFCSYFVKEMKGDEFNLSYLQNNGFESPVMIRDKTGLGMRLPSKNFNVNDVRQCVGSRRMLDVMDVTTQKDIEMSMKDWVKYYENPLRDKLLNVISLEFSHTKLENYVESPTMVREIDWVDRVWPRHLKQSQTEATNIIEDMKYPKVQKYCLMSVKGCYTDFHIDFGGTSVWYHILRGSKVFWLIPPTERNLQLYETWVLSGKQGDVFFGDTVENCGRIHLEEGWTFFIPTGWIHAVYTPQDSLVFGGNFLHSFGIEKQLRIAQIEDSTHVPTKFRYPFYTEILWYVLERYVHCLFGRSHLYAVDSDGNPVNGLVTPTPATKTKEIKRERESSSTERPNGAMITPPESPCSQAVENSPIAGYIGNPQLAVSLAAATAAKAKTPVGSILPFGKLVGGNDVAFYNHAFTVNTPKFSHPENLPADGRIDATNVEAVRRILDGVARIHHQPMQSSFESSETVAAAPAPPPGPHTHITKLELDGLKAILKWLTNLPPSKKNVPDLIKNPNALLADVKLLLECHKNDDPKLAVTGKPALAWPDSPPKIRPTNKPKSGPPSGSKSKSSSKNNSSARRRRTRCKKCEACLRTDCGECHFCKDMRKFGGPGRMKQSCISRQCMAPVLPHTACCMVCGKDGWEKLENSEEEVSSLMECSICWEIVHPECLRTRLGNMEGLMNEDLPNSWECPRCCVDGKGGQSKPRQIKGARHKPSDILRSPLGAGVPNCSMELGREMSNTERPPVFVPEVEQPVLELSPEVVQQSLLKRGPLNDEDSKPAPKKIKLEEVAPQLMEEVKPFEKSVENGLPLLEKTVKVEEKKKRKVESPPPLKVVKVEGESHVRSCSQGRNEEKPLLTKPSPRPNTASPLQGNLQLRPRPSSRVLAAQNGNTPNVPSDVNKTDLKSEIKHKGIMKCEVKVEKCDADLIQRKRKISLSQSRSPQDCIGPTRNSRLHMRNAVQNPSRLQPRVVANGKSHLRKPLYVVRPAPLSVDKKTEAKERNDTNYALDRDVMMCIFKYLPRGDLCRCMLVCKVWNQWCLDSELWEHINLTKRKITAQHLAGLVRRQPKSLVLAWTNISKKLLGWLLSRLPQLKHLDLTGCSSAAVTALRTCNCPMLTSLNLKLVEGFHDSLLRELLSSPPDSRPGLIESRTRLRNLNQLCLSGCDVTDVSVRYITQHLRLLTHLDISQCSKLTDASLSLLGAVGSVTRDTLTHLNASGCKKLTDISLEHLRRCTNLIHIDLRSCPEVTPNACKTFISQSKHKLILVKSKLIERQ